MKNLEKEATLHDQYTYKSDVQRAYTLKQNKIAMSPNDDKRLQTYDIITTYQYGTPSLKVCKSELLANKHKLPILSDK